MYLKARQVSIHLLESEVEVSIPGLDGIHALPKLASIPHILSKGGTHLHQLVPNLHTLTAYKKKYTKSCLAFLLSLLQAWLPLGRCNLHNTDPFQSIWNDQSMNHQYTKAAWLSNEHCPLLISRKVMRALRCDDLPLFSHQCCLLSYPLE